MYKHRSKRFETWRIITILVFIPLIVGILLTLASLYMIGYRFDLKKHVVEQNGLVQFDSRPKTAKITVDGKELSSRTATKSMLSSGSHNITMTLDGYMPWQKTVTVDPGKILWLNYARMIPNEIKTSTAADLPRADSVLASTDTSTIYVMKDASKPVVEQYYGDNDAVKHKTISIPANFIATAKKSSTSKYRLVSTDSSGSYIIVEHTYDKTSEWIYLDIGNPSHSLNVTSLVKAPVQSIKFDPTNNRTLYVTSGDALMMLNASKATLSSPLIRDVADFSLDDRGTVLYVSKFDTKTNKRSIGYLTKNAHSAKVVRTFYTNGSLPIQFIEDKYVDANYFALRYGSTLEISSGALPSSDSSDSVSLTNVATISLTGQDSSTIDFSPNNRFVVVTHGETFMTYDLELNKLNTSAQRGNGAASRLAWLDQTSIISTRGGILQYYEFDGENSHQLLTNVIANATVYSPDRNVIYTLQKVDGDVKLVKINLLVEK